MTKSNLLQHCCDELVLVKDIVLVLKNSVVYISSFTMQNTEIICINAYSANANVRHTASRAIMSVRHGLRLFRHLRLGLRKVVVQQIFESDN